MDKILHHQGWWLSHYVLTIHKWLALGFLNHQQYHSHDETKIIPDTGRFQPSTLRTILSAGGFWHLSKSHGDLLLPTRTNPARRRFVGTVLRFVVQQSESVLPRWSSPNLDEAIGYKRTLEGPSLSEITAQKEKHRTTKPMTRNNSVLILNGITGQISEDKAQRYEHVVQVKCRCSSWWLQYATIPLKENMLVKWFNSLKFQGKKTSNNLWNHHLVT